jgi:hypothetical protein
MVVQMRDDWIMRALTLLMGTSIDEFIAEWAIRKWSPVGYWRYAPEGYIVFFFLAVLGFELRA